MKVHSERPKHLLTLAGEVTLWRAYYYHARCHSQAIPRDAELGLGAGCLSSGVEAAVCLTSAHLPFAEATRLVEQLSGVRVSAVTAQTVAETVGLEIAAAQQAEQAAAWAGKLPEAPATTPERLYVGVDGVIVPFDDGWHELKVAALYEVEARPSDPTEREPTETLHAVNATYLATQAEAREFGKAVWVEAAKRGVAQATEVVIVADGAAWVWNLAYSQFGAYQRVEIVDWYHACQHLWMAGAALYGEGSDLTQHWVKARRDELWHGQFDTMLMALDAAAEAHPRAAQPLTEQRAYFESHRARMRYADFRAAGYQIGSGTVESACKRVIGARLKQAGMMWSARGAKAMAHLRALILSGRWDTFWRQRQPPQRHYHRHAA